MQWFAVRMIYEHSRGSEQPRTFEERIVMVRAPDAEAAHTSALEESNRYLSINPTFRRSENVGVFVLGHGDATLEGREVWSNLLHSPDDLEQFVQRRYEEPLRDA